MGGRLILDLLPIFLESTITLLPDGLPTWYLHSRLTVSGSTHLGKLTKALSKITIERLEGKTRRL